MFISTGLCDGMVLQRTPKNSCDTIIKGICDSSGELYARVISGGRDIEGFEIQRIGAARKGHIKGRLKGIPTGGPYDIVLLIRNSNGEISESLNVNSVLVGDVWILAGQSNMQGIGIVKQPLLPNDRVRAFYMCDKWGVAIDPLHDIRNAVDSVHAKLLSIAPKPISALQEPPKEEMIGSRSRGPGVMFGQEMERITGVPQGLIPCAHGATNMRQWSPGKKKLAGNSLYGATLRRFQKNGSRVKGILWYQGCSEETPNDVRLYSSRMKKLIAAFRDDMHDKKLPFIITQISRTSFITWPNPEVWMSIREKQRLLGLEVKHCVTVPTIDLDIDDGIHIGGEDQLRLGRRLANATSAIIKIDKASRPPIEIENIKIKKSKVDYHQIEVSFKNIIGGLASQGRPNGFELADSNADLIGGIYKIEISRPNTLILFTSISEKNELRKMFLVYGYGLNPYCNITDQADRAIPAFGPISLNIVLHNKL